MNEFINHVVITFLALFPVLNPPAMAPIFNELTSELDKKRKAKVAYLVAKYSFYLLTLSLLFGSWILGLFDISVSVIKLAGGIILFNIAWNMLNEKPKISEEQKEVYIKIDEKTAFYPMTLPLTAGAGSISVTISLVPENISLSFNTFLKLLAVIFGIFISAVSVYIFYRYSSLIIKKLDYSKQQIISKLSAFILLAIAIKISIDAIKSIL